MNNATIGIPARRVDGFDKVTGRAKYTADLKLPGMLYGKVLRSPLPHARIISIDTSQAEAMPGVRAVLTREDIKDIQPYYGHTLKDRPAIAIDKVRYVGDPVAVVCAETEQQAEEALSAVHVEYEELDYVTDVVAALAEDAPIIHERILSKGNFHDLEGLENRRKDNVCFEYKEEHGDVDEAFANADYVFEDFFTFPAVYQYSMEPHAVLADVTPESITVYASAQHPFIVRSELAEMFGYPLNKTRLIIPYIGGGFGSKSYTKIEPMVVAASRKAKRPVLVELSVYEAFHTNRRHSAQMKVKTAVSKDGYILARECDILLDTGAYADNGPRVTRQAATRILGVYNTPAYRVRSRAIYTNTTPAGSYRAIGAPQGVWACETQLDMIADRLGWDPIEFRRKNLPARGEQFRPNLKEMDADIRDGFERLVKAIEGQLPVDQRPPYGIAAATTGAGAGPVSTAIARLHADGTVSLFASSTELGQGIRTALCQIAANELSIPLENVRISRPDTDITPFDRSTGASRSTTVAGSAVMLAARDLRDQVLDLTAQLFDLNRESLRLEDGHVTDGGETRIPLKEVVQKFYGMPGGELIGRGYSGPHSASKHLATNPVFWEVGLGAAEVDVDEETGEVRIASYVACGDVGKAINPMLVHGQEVGALMQGIGHSLFEEVIVQNGEIMNANLIDYRVPTFVDVPQKLQSILVENEDGPGPYGARGTGEAGLIPAAAALGNAVFRKTGARLTDLPMTPERVWRALQNRKQTTSQ